MSTVDVAQALVAAAMCMVLATMVAAGRRDQKAAQWLLAEARAHLEELKDLNRRSREMLAEARRGYSGPRRRRG